MMDLILLLQADLDIQAAFARYEEFQSGRGEVFLHQLDAALSLVRRFPEIGPAYGGAYRRFLIRDFPFGIFYEAQAARIVVVSIMDLRQNPQEIRRRLFGSHGTAE